MADSQISERAGILLKTLVEQHIRDGQPVGSRTLQEAAGLPVSAATIRNVMSDLEERGYLHSPHTSAGRVPTAMGYRLFVDTLLQVQPLEDEAMAILRAELHPDKSSTELVQSSSSLVVVVALDLAGAGAIGLVDVLGSAAVAFGSCCMLSLKYSSGCALAKARTLRV